MAKLTLSTEAQAALDQPKTRFIYNGKLVKFGWNADLRDEIDITEDVIDWGTLKLSSSAEGENWEKPNVTVLVRNRDNLYNKDHVSSFFQAATAQEVRKLWYEFTLSLVHLDGVTKENVLFYRGVLEDAVLRYDMELATVEIVTVCVQNTGLAKFVAKTEGGLLILRESAW